MADERASTAIAEPSQSLITLTHVIYGLHAFSLLTGIIGAATVVGAFLTGWPSIIAVILNYVKRSEARGTWLESHFRWQIRTFWYSLLWFGVGLALLIVVIGLFVFMALAMWLLYRAIKGWLELEERRPMYS